MKIDPRLQGRPLHEILREYGVVGAGGAGFPTWAKYTAPQPTLVVNAQESEPGYFIDKWLHHERAVDLVDLLAWLRAWGVGRTVVAAKLKDRASFARMESAAGVDVGRARVLDCTGRNRHNLDEQTEPMLFAYTDDRYAYGMETALLLIVAQKKIPQGERPVQHGFIVSNTETLVNVFDVLTTGRPVTTKYVHVYGATPQHTFRQVPVGTPASLVLQDAGLPVDAIKARGLVVVDGGPGWFERVDPDLAVVTRRTNSLLVLDPAFVDVTKKDVLPGPGRNGYPLLDTPFARQPTPLSGSTVRLPFVDNPAFRAVRPAVPIVAVGDHVDVGDLVARANDDGVSVAVHASIAGTVTAIDERGLEIRG
jgi:Na+-translocating ferredoxin:NAD+ oxidoreductase RnfC subunit